MCIAFFGYQLQNDHNDVVLPFVLASNRDEFWSRPTQPMHWWNGNENDDDDDDDRPPILAGKDLQQGGTWLAVSIKNQEIRLAVVTNFREGTEQQQHHASWSRGKLVTDFMTCDSLRNYTTHLEAQSQQYAGFNLLFGSPSWGFYFYSNRGTKPQQRVQPLQPNRIYGMSNGGLDEAWPKLVRGKQALTQALQRTALSSSSTKENGHKDIVQQADLLQGLWDVLTDEWKPADKDLPNTGVAVDIEKVLSSIFVQGPQYDYGTRCSTLILQSAQGLWQIQERTYHQREEEHGKKTKMVYPREEFTERVFRLKPELRESGGFACTSTETNQSDIHDILRYNNTLENENLA